MSALVPMIGTPAAASSRASLSGVAAVLHDHAEGLFLVDDLEHVLERERLEVEAVGGVVVGRHRLRIAIDHDGLEAVLAQRHRRVHAAIVEFDSLADAVRPAAQHHDFLALRRLGFALLLVGGVQVGRARRELGGAGVHPLVDRTDVERVSFRPYGFLVGVEKVGEPAIGEAFSFQISQLYFVNIF
jgi:hypothetical protein